MIITQCAQYRIFAVICSPRTPGVALARIHISVSQNEVPDLHMRNCSKPRPICTYLSLGSTTYLIRSTKHLRTVDTWDILKGRLLRYGAAEARMSKLSLQAYKIVARGDMLTVVPRTCPHLSEALSLCRTECHEIAIISASWRD